MQAHAHTLSASAYEYKTNQDLPRIAHDQLNSAAGERASKLDLFQLIHELLAEFGHLWPDDRETIRLARVVAEVVLVIVLGRIELFQRRHLRHDRLRPDPLRVEFGDQLLGDTFL